MARQRRRDPIPGWTPETWRPFPDEGAHQQARDIGRRMARVMRRLYPKPTVLERWAYECTWYDQASGREFGSYLTTVTLPAGQSYQKASRDARANIYRTMPACIQRLTAAGWHIKLRCRRVGDPITVR